MASPETTDLLTRLRQHAGPAIMGCTCSSRLPNCPACDCGHAADEIERLHDEVIKWKDEATALLARAMKAELAAARVRLANV